MFAVRPQDDVFLGTAAEVELDGVAVGEGVGEEGHGWFQGWFKRIWFQVALGYLKIFMLVQTHQPTAGRLMPDIFA